MSYILGIYLMMVIVVIAVAYTTTPNPVLRGTILILGIGAPFVALYILVRACRSHELSTEEMEQFLIVRDEIEEARQERFGGTKSVRTKIKIEYIRSLDKTKDVVERFVGRFAA